MIATLDQLDRGKKAALILLADALLVPVCWAAALVLRLNDFLPQHWFVTSLPAMGLSTVLVIVFGLWLRNHRVQISAFDAHGARRSALWAMAVSLSVFAANIVLDLGAPRTVPLIFGLLLLMASIVVRQIVAVSLAGLRQQRGDRKRVAIYGAGSGGLQIAAALRQSPENQPVLFIDDKKSLKGIDIAGLRVHSSDEIGKLLEEGRFEAIFLAIPSLSSVVRRRLLAKLGKHDTEVLELPSYADIIKSGGFIESVKPVSTGDLLGRPHIDFVFDEIDEVYKSGTILVTGAGGSIGSELCQRILQVKPSKLVLFEVSEFALYTIHRELLEAASEREIELVACLGSVQDKQRMLDIIREHNVTAVFHAAAYKHVPIVENNILEAAKNNVLGTVMAAQAAVEGGANRFILISTDKAVRPTNVMGATKRLAEIMVQTVQKDAAKTTLAIVRFGNVIGSSGSVIPLFRQQIATGGPVTVTHPDVTRFFMSTPEAARLVLLAGAFAEGGEAFLLDMGEPVRIIDLAHRMIALSGLNVRDEDNPNGDIAIEVTGLRPGEKLYEELLVGKDELPTPHPKILRAREGAPDFDRDIVAEALQLIADRDEAGLLAMMTDVVDGFARFAGSDADGSVLVSENSK